MATTFRPAPELAKRAEPTMSDYHNRLLGERVVWLWRSKAGKSSDKYVAGKSMVVSGREAVLHMMNLPGITEVELEEEAQMFVIEVAEDMWALLDSDGKDALIDHLLYHCGIKADSSGEVKYFICGHDINEFDDIKTRRGDWLNPAMTA